VQDAQVHPKRTYVYVRQSTLAQVHENMPAWGLYLGLPWLVGGAGVFACLMGPGPDLHTLGDHEDPLVSDH
jgi:hypothetical protein